jgi:hypothetical protein
MCAVLIFPATFQTVSASYLIDSGSRGVYNPDTGEKTGYWYYKTWNEGDKLHTSINAYLTGEWKFLTINIYLKKTTSDQLKVYLTYKWVGEDTTAVTKYISTNKSATSWYWNKPLIRCMKIRFGIYSVYCDIPCILPERIIP